MTRRAQRPLDAAAVLKADDAFYAAHPEMVDGGKRVSIPVSPNDPCSKLMSEEWLDTYVANGGKVDSKSFPTCKVGSVATPCPAAKKALTASEAAAAFNVLAGNRNTPFNYPVDCCYSRAHSMCQTLEDKGIESQKVWYFAKDWGTAGSTSDLHPVKPDGTPVAFPDPMGTSQPVRWVYHVAPIIKVIQSDGSTQDMVMDPSVAKRPLTKDEWKKIQGTPKGAYEEVSDRDAYFQNQHFGYRQEDPDLREACAQMQKHQRDRDAALRANKKSGGP